jgi:ribosomal protein S12
VTTSDCIVLVDGIRITSVSGVLFKGVEDEENIKRKQITKLERKKRERDERYI